MVLAIYRYNFFKSGYLSLLKSQERYHRTAQWRFKCISILKTKGDLYQPLNMSFSFYHRRNLINTSRLQTVLSCLSVISWERRGYGKFLNTVLSLAPIATLPGLSLLCLTMKVCFIFQFILIYFYINVRHCRFVITSVPCDDTAPTSEMNLVFCCRWRTEINSREIEW